MVVYRWVARRRGSYLGPSQLTSFGIYEFINCNYLEITLIVVVVLADIAADDDNDHDDLMMNMVLATLMKDIYKQG